MNGFLKEEHDSDVEVLNPQVLKKEWLNNQVSLATQLMSCGKRIPKQWIEFEKFVQENIDWQPSFGLICSLWKKMCKVEENNISHSPNDELEKNNDSAGDRYSQKETEELTEFTNSPYSGLSIDSSLSPDTSSKKEKRKKRNSQTLLFEDDLISDKRSITSPDSNRTSQPEKEETGNPENSFIDVPRLSSSKVKKKQKDELPSSSHLVSSEILNGKYKSNSSLDQKCMDISSDSNDTSSKKNKKRRKTADFLGSSSSIESDNQNHLNIEDCFSHCYHKKKRHYNNRPSEISDNPTNSKKNKKISASTTGEKSVIKNNNSPSNSNKKKKSAVMSEAEADALREELLADRILELELPTVLKEMKGAITKIDKCISNLEMKGKLKKIEKQISKVEKKSIIKKLDKRKSI